METERLKEEFDQKNSWVITLLNVSPVANNGVKCPLYKQNQRDPKKLQVTHSNAHAHGKDMHVRVATNRASILLANMRPGQLKTDEENLP